MPFRLTNALATCQQMMDEMLADVKGKWAWVHMDTLLIYSRSWAAHLAQMEEVFKHLHEQGIMLKISK